MSEDENETIEIEVTPEMRRFMPKLRASLASFQRSMQATVRTVLDVSGMREQFRQIQREVDRQARANPVTIPAPLESSPSNSPPGRQRDANGRFVRQGTAAQVDVDAQTMGASAHIAAFIARKRKLIIDAELGKKSLAGVGSAIAALSGARVAGDGIKKLGTELGQLDRSTPKIAAIGSGIGGLLAISLSAVGGVASLGTSLAGLAGLAGLVPAAVGAAGASLGVLLASFSGMGDAIGGIKKNAEAAAAPKANPLIEQMRRQQELNAVTEAQTSLNESVIDGDKRVASAKADVTQAIIDEQRAIDRLNASYEVAKVDSEKAYDAMVEAKKALAQTKGDDSASASEKKALARKVRETQAAYNQQKGITADLAADASKAAKDGVQGSERVLSAKEKLAAAEEQADRSQAAAKKSLNDANAALLISDMARADAQKAASAEATKSMNELTPSAQIAAVAISEVLGRLKEVQAIAQESFFSGFAAPFTHLADVVIPQLKIGVAGLAGSMGAGVQQLMTSLSSSLGGGVLERMFGNTTAANDILNGSIEPLTRAFVKIGDVGSSFLPQLATGFTDISTTFGAFIDRVSADGSLAAWIQTGIDTAKDLGGVLSGSFGILGAIGKAASDAGGSTVKSLGDTLKGIADTMNKEPFQSALRVIFEGANEAMSNMGKSLGPIGDMFLQLAPTLKTVLPIIGSILGEGLSGIAELLGDPVLQQGLKSMFGGILAGVEGLRPAMGPLGQLMGNIAEVVGKLAEKLGPIIGMLITELAPVFGVLLDATMPLIDSLSSMLMTVLPALMPLVQAAAGILMALIGMVTGLSDVITTLFDPLFWDVVSGMWGDFWDDTLGMISDFRENTRGMIKDFLDQTVGMFTDFGTNAGNAIGDAVEGIFDWFEKLPETIGNILSGAGSWFIDVGKDMVGGLLEGVQSMAGEIGKFFLDILPGWMVEPFKLALDINSPSRVFRKLGAFVGMGAVEGVESEKDNINKAMSSLVTIPKVNTSDLAKSARASVKAMAAAAGVRPGAVSAKALTGAAQAAGGRSTGDTFISYENVSARNTMIQALRLRGRQN